MPTTTPPHFWTVTPIPLVISLASPSSTAYGNPLPGFYHTMNKAQARWSPSNPTSPPWQWCRERRQPTCGWILRAEKPPSYVCFPLLTPLLVERTLTATTVQEFNLLCKVPSSDAYPSAWLTWSPFYSPDCAWILLPWFPPGSQE